MIKPDVRLQKEEKSRIVIRSNKLLRGLWKLTSRMDHHVRIPVMEDMFANHRKTVPPVVFTFRYARSPISAVSAIPANGIPFFVQCENIFGAI